MYLMMQKIRIKDFSFKAVVSIAEPLENDI